MSIKIKNMSNTIFDGLSNLKDKLDHIVNLLQEKNNYSEFWYFDYDKTNFVLLTQNLILQKQVALQISELKNPQFFVSKEIDGFLISQSLILNIQIDEFDLNQYLNKRKVNLMQLYRLKTFDQSSLNFVRQIEDSVVYNKSIKDLIISNDFSECKSVDSIYLNLCQTNLDISTLNLLSQSLLGSNKIQILSLHLNSNGLNSESVTQLSKTIENMSLLSNLTLNLSENQIESRGLIQIAAGMNKLQLKALTMHLRENQIGSNGAKALGQLFENQQQLNSLFLNLSFNKIKSDGASSLIQGVSKCSQIQNVNINLQNNQIRQLKELSNHIITQKGLKNLDIQLQNNKIQSEEQSSLAQIITELKNTNTQISLLQGTLIVNTTSSELEFQQNIRLQKVCSQTINSLGSNIASLSDVQSLSIEIKNSKIEENEMNNLGKGLQNCSSLNDLMIEFKGSKFSEDQQLGFICFIKCLNISKIQIKASDLTIETTSQNFKKYELIFKSVGFPLFKMLCDNLCILDKFISLKLDLKFCKIGEEGIIYLGEQLQKLKSLQCLHIVTMISDIGKSGVIQFFKKIKTIKGINKLTFEYYGNSLFDAEKKKYINIGIKAPYLVEFCFTN
ncbi:hypothetical protein ABPG74_013203 [Tetrahymena malaccensis]